MKSKAISKFGKTPSATEKTTTLIVRRLVVTTAIKKASASRGVPPQTRRA